MDVSTILMAAGTILGKKAVEESTKFAVTEMWASLKSLVSRQRGEDSAALVVLDEVARRPADSPAPPELGARIEALRLGDDPAIAELLQRIECLLQQRAPTLVEKQYNFNGGSFSNMTFN